jgi:predicted cobalt transporter CbtA
VKAQERTQEPPDDPAWVPAEGLRRVAVASAAALVVVLTLAVATAGHRHDDHRPGNAGHSTVHREPPPAAVG